MADQHLRYDAFPDSDDDDDDDFQAILAAQRRELNEAQALESDLDYAFHLQLQEALSASLALAPPPPPNSSTPQPDIVIPIEDKPTTTSKLVDLQSEEPSKREQQSRDMFKRVTNTIHDLNLSRVHRRIPGEVWWDSGFYGQQVGEGSSSTGPGSSRGRVVIGGGDDDDDDDDEVFRIYLKGIVSEEKVNGSNVMLAGIGVAICDSSDVVIYEVEKPMIGCGTSRQVTEVRALIEGLNAALALDLKRLICFVDYYPIIKYVTRKWKPKPAQLAALVNEFFILQRKFYSCTVHFIARSEIKFAFKLARQAIISQITTPAESSSGNIAAPAESSTASIPKESCVICLEDSDVSQIFSVDNCLHRYCFSCMKQHVEVKLLHGMLPKCPHEACKSELNVDSCKTFLTPKLLAILEQRLKEAAIPTTEKVYCPNPKCSVLMSKVVLLDPRRYHLNLGLGARNCIKCYRLFCMECKVPWHHNMTCYQYKKLNPHHREEETKLKSLATRNLWRQCVKCNHMIELSEGCYHITCRCGNEFCYTCGAEWKDKKATCKCPLWDERNIINNEDDDDDDDDDEDDDDDDDDDEDDAEDFYSDGEDDDDGEWELDSESNEILVL